MRLLIVDDVPQITEWIAGNFRDRLIEFNPSEDVHFVVGLPVGSSAASVYDKLIQYHNQGEISFKYVTAFVIDEYVGLYREHPSTQHSRMWRDLFSKVDIDPANVHILDGNATDWMAECVSFEAKIAEEGGLDFMFMGSGADGHVARNEPGSSQTSRTRVKTLAYKTIQELKPYFQRTSKDDYFSGVPTKCLTMGLGTLHEAREMIIMFSGKAQAVCLSNAIEKGMNHMWPVSVFQSHKNCTFLCDEGATAELKVKTVHYFKGLLSNYQLSVLGNDATPGQSLAQAPTDLNHHLTPLHARHTMSNPKASSVLPPSAADLDGLPMGAFTSPGLKLKEQKIEDQRRRRALMGANAIEASGSEQTTGGGGATMSTAAAATETMSEVVGEGEGEVQRGGRGGEKRSAAKASKTAEPVPAVVTVKAAAAAGGAKKKAKLRSASGTKGRQ
jgi:glucosamine-6-phosphate deaminase